MYVSVWYLFLSERLVRLQSECFIPNWLNCRLVDHCLLGGLLQFNNAIWIRRYWKCVYENIKRKGGNRDWRLIVVGSHSECRRRIIPRSLGLRERADSTAHDDVMQLDTISHNKGGGFVNHSRKSPFMSTSFVTLSLSLSEWQTVDEAVESKYVPVTQSLWAFLSFFSSMCNQ